MTGMEAEALEVLKTISNSLGHLDLRAIDLSDNALGEKGVRACDAILLKKKCLQQLWFNNNGISAECAAVIAEIVSSPPADLCIPTHSRSLFCFTLDRCCRTTLPASPFSTSTTT